MNETPFEASRLKIKRADSHVNYFCNLMKFFFQKKFFEIAAKTDTATGAQFLNLEFVAKPPPEMPLVIGDAAFRTEECASGKISCYGRLRRQPRAPCSW